MCWVTPNFWKNALTAEKKNKSQELDDSNINIYVPVNKRIKFLLFV